jgi:site-specific DNA-methyltransferase (adenine-specific)
MLNKITQGSCYELLPLLEDNSIDMLFCDLPYATKKRKCTANDWDKPMDLPRLWIEFNRVCKPNAAMVFTANMHLAFELYATNKQAYKYEWIWVKDRASGYMNAHKNPLPSHEFILIYGNNKLTYNPIKTKILNKNAHSPMLAGKQCMDSNYGKQKQTIYIDDLTRFPTSILYIDLDKRPHINGKWGNHGIDRHPTQKPVELLKYLIKTYTHDGATVLDPTAGSCTTAVACIQTNRNFICLEQLEKYCDIGNERIRRTSSKVASQLFTPSQIHSQVPMF